jgi:hypothetical protein
MAANFKIALMGKTYVYVLNYVAWGRISKCSNSQHMGKYCANNTSLILCLLIV